MVLMPCRAADTGTGTELSATLTAVSLSTPVIRKRTVGRMVMLPAEGKINGKGSFHSEHRCVTVNRTQHHYHTQTGITQAKQAIIVVKE